MKYFPFRVTKYFLCIILISTLRLAAQKPPVIITSGDTPYNLLGEKNSSSKNVETAVVLELTKQGPVTFSASDNILNGTINAFKLENIERVYPWEDSVMMRYITDASSNTIDIGGGKKEEKRPDPLAYVEVTYKKDLKDNWVIKNFLGFKSEIRLALKSKLVDFIADQTMLANKEDTLFYPKKVKIGDTWTVQGQALHSFLGHIGDDLDGTCEMTLKNIYYPDKNQPIATIGLKMNLNVKESQPDAVIIDMAFEGELQRSLTDYIDLSVNLIGRIKVNSDTEADVASPTKFHMSFPARFTRTQKLLPVL